MNRPNVLLSYCSQGRGHLENMRVVWNIVYDLGYNPLFIPTPTPELVYENHTLALFKSIRANMDFNSSQRRYANFVRAHIKTTKPAAVITDFEPILGYVAQSLGIKSIAVCSQASYFFQEYADRSFKEKFYRKLYEYKLEEALKHSDFILVPTFHEAEIEYSFSKNFCGPLYRKDLRNWAPSIIKDKVVRSFTKELGGNVTKPFTDDDLLTCDYVVATGGHNLISECILLEKPMLLFPIKNHYEQLMNARFVEKHGIGVIGDINNMELSIAHFKGVKELCRKRYATAAINSWLSGNEFVHEKLSAILP